MNIPSLFRFLIPAVILTAITCCTSLLLTKWLLTLLPRWGMLDKPDHARRIHTIAIPRGGGIGIVIAFILTSLLYAICVFNRDDAVLLKFSQLKLLLPLCILVPLGIIDDKKTLNARTKFFFQGVTALAAWTLGIRINSILGWNLPPVFSCIFTIIWITAMINAFNMIDGVDGLASGVGCISAVSMAIIAISNEQFWEAILLFSFAGALLGFLRYNYHPAKIFMGDTGSMFIGYFLGVSGISLSARLASVFSVFIPLLACGVPFIDIVFAVWRRLTTPESLGKETGSADDNDDTSASKHPDNFFWRCLTLVGRLGRADRRHLHHRLLVRYNNNQLRTVHSIYWLAIGLGLISVLCYKIEQKNVIIAFAIVIVAASMVISKLANVEMWNSAELIYHNFQQAKFGFILSIINPIVDLCIIFVAYWLATPEMKLSISALIRHMACVGVVLAFSRNYRILWNLLCLDDCFRLIMTIISGCLLAFVVDHMYPVNFPSIGHLHACGLIATLVIGHRLSLHFLRNYMIRKHAEDHMTAYLQSRNVAIFGISPEARLYRNRLNTNFNAAVAENLKGLISADRSFRHAFCYGMQVLGCLDDLQAIQNKYQLSKILISGPVSPRIGKILKDFASQHDIELVRIETIIRPFAENE